MNWTLRTRTLDLDRPAIMGIVNVTPDSFSDGGQFTSSTEAIAHARRLLADGADIVDVGGESTRPGAEPVDVESEIARVIPVIQALVSDGAIVSIDTSKAAVAEAATSAGAEIINDVTGFRDLGMQEVAVASRAGVVIMHMAGTPRTMQDDPTYDDVTEEVGAYLVDQASQLEARGLGRERICIDPGIGFGKTVTHNLQLLADTPTLSSLGYPLMVGASRKRFLGTLLGIAEPDLRDEATSVLSGLVGFLGADVIRVHDVAGSRKATLLSSAMVAVK